MFVRALSEKTRIQGGERPSLKLKRFVFSHHSKTSGASRANKRGLYRSRNGGCESVFEAPVPVFSISPSLALSLPLCLTEAMKRGHVRTQAHTAKTRLFIGGPNLVLLTLAVPHSYSKQPHMALDGTAKLKLRIAAGSLHDARSTSKHATQIPWKRGWKSFFMTWGVG